MVLRHVVCLKFQQGVSDEQRKALTEGLSKLPASIPAILAYRFGHDAGLDPERNHDFVIMGDFESAEDYATYANHPAHVDLIQKHVKPILAPGGRVAVQFELTGDLGDVSPGTDLGRLAPLCGFRQQLHSSADTIAFKDTLALVEDHFDYNPKKFVNGSTESAAGANEGSCKVFSMGKLLGWSEKEVLTAFGEHYRQVLGDPNGSSHGNIRAFMKEGWPGVHFPEGLSLVQNGLLSFRQQINAAGASVIFKDTLRLLEDYFDYTPKKFINGGTESAAGANEGSCKVFSMGKLLGWGENEVLASFGEHYRQVLGDPDGSSHGNIRAFMKQGWGGVQFPDGLALSRGPASKRRRSN